MWTDPYPSTRFYSFTDFKETGFCSINLFLQLTFTMLVQGCICQGQRQIQLIVILAGIKKLFKLPSLRQRLGGYSVSQFVVVNLNLQKPVMIIAYHVRGRGGSHFLGLSELLLHLSCWMPDELTLEGILRWFGANQRSPFADRKRYITESWARRHC